MKYIFMILIVVNISIFADDKIKTYDFSDMSVNGDFVKPELLKIKDKNTAKFNRMLKLKASFINKLEKTNKDNSIK